MRYLKINDQEIPAQVLITYRNRNTGEELTNHYCFRSSKDKTYLICHKIDGKIPEKKINFFMSFVLSNQSIPMS